MSDHHGMKLRYLQASELVSFFSSLTMIVVGIWGLLGNLLSIRIFRIRKVRSPVSLLLATISFVDILLIVFSIAVFGVQSISYINPSRKIEVYLVFSAIFLYPILMVVQTMRIWLTVILTVERYIAVMYLLHAKAIITHSRTVKAIVITMVLSTSYNFVRFWEYKAKFTDIYNITITERLRQNQAYFLWYYTAAYLLTHFLLPFSIIACLSLKNLNIILQARRERRRLTLHQMREHRICCMVIIVIVMFLATRTAPFVLNVIEAFNRSMMEISWTLTTEFYACIDVSNLLVVMDSSFTWIIYLYFNKQYRGYFATAMSKWSSLDQPEPSRDFTTNYMRSRGGGNDPRSPRSPLSRKNSLAPESYFAPRASYEPIPGINSAQTFTTGLEESSRNRLTITISTA